MAKARLVWHEDGSISAHEIVEPQSERVEIFYNPEMINVQQVTAMMEALMSVVLGKAVKLEVVGKPEIKKLSETRNFVPLGKPMAL